MNPYKPPECEAAPGRFDLALVIWASGAVLFTAFTVEASAKGDNYQLLIHSSAAACWWLNALIRLLNLKKP